MPPSANAVTVVPKNYYDVIVFCLLLEYLPTPQMRYDVVAKAASAVRDGGLIIIVTPDSSHQERDS
jgi:25S rRNA (adenine2142-N1)-methyltransferase